MARLTVRTEDHDIPGDTVLVEDGELTVMGHELDETVSLDETRSIIAGPPAVPREEVEG